MSSKLTVCLCATIFDIDLLHEPDRMLKIQCDHYGFCFLKKFSGMWPRFHLIPIILQPIMSSTELLFQCSLEILSHSYIRHKVKNGSKNRGENEIPISFNYFSHSFFNSDMTINEALHYFQYGYLTEWCYAPYIIALIFTKDKYVSTSLRSLLVRQ